MGVSRFTRHAALHIKLRQVLFFFKFRFGKIVGGLNDIGRHAEQNENRWK
jgi:hypothetical protein